MRDEIELVVCVTCRAAAAADAAPQEAPPDAPCDGARLSAALADRGVAHRPHACLAACKRGCAVALRGGPARWSFVQGGLSPDHDVDALIAMLDAYRVAPAGLVPWRARPEVMRKNIIARIPPEDL